MASKDPECAVVETAVVGCDDDAQPPEPPQEQVHATRGSSLSLVSDFVKVEREREPEMSGEFCLCSA